MESILDLLPEGLMEAIAWTLLHSLWQGLVIALMLVLVLLILRKAVSLKRYYFLITAFVLFLAGSIFTFLQCYRSESNAVNKSFAGKAFALAETNSLGDHIENSTGFFSGLGEIFGSNLSLVFTLWFIGMLLFSFRFLGGLVYTQRLKYFAVEKTSGILQDKFDSIKQKLSVRKRVDLLYSKLARVPMLAGYFRPVILLPASIMSHVPYEQIEAILIHELIHLKRHDNLINLFQRLMEIIFFFNPAVWWISGIVRKERESTCDEIAMEYYQDKISYAKALANVEEFRQNIPVCAAAFTGNRNYLMNRIKRLTMKKHRNNNYLSGLLAVILVFGTLIVFTAKGKIFNSNGEHVFYDQYSEDGTINTSPNTPFMPGQDTNRSVKEKKIIQKELQKLTEKIREEFPNEAYDKAMKQWQHKHQEYLEQMQELQKEKLIKQMDKHAELLEKMKHQDWVRHPYFSRSDSNILLQDYDFDFDYDVEFEMPEMPEMPELPEMPEMPEMEEWNKEMQEYYQSDEWKEVQKQIWENAEKMSKLQHARIAEELEKNNDMLMVYKNKARDYAARAKDYDHWYSNEFHMKKRIREELLEDGLIGRHENSLIELSKNKIYIDGEKQRRKYGKKYSNLYEALTGKVLKDEVIFDLY
ncbi:MAG: M56 family metallopeptidase [Bacteroidales bacterium]|nr:M56 family metallopeptidase [Bacteroidales bacterium]